MKSFSVVVAQNDCENFVINFGAWVKFPHAKYLTIGKNADIL